MTMTMTMTMTTTMRTTTVILTTSTTKRRRTTMMTTWTTILMKGGTRIVAGSAVGPNPREGDLHLNGSSVALLRAPPTFPASSYPVSGSKRPWRPFAESIS